MLNLRERFVKSNKVLSVIDDAIALAFSLLKWLIIVVFSFYIWYNFAGLIVVAYFGCLISYVFWTVIYATDPRNVLPEFKEQYEKTQNEMFLENWEREEQYKENDPKLW